MFIFSGEHFRNKHNEKKSVLLYDDNCIYLYEVITNVTPALRMWNGEYRHAFLGSRWEACRMFMLETKRVSNIPSFLDFGVNEMNDEFQKQLLPQWTLQLKSDMIAVLAFSLPMPFFINKNDIIGVDCCILDVPYKEYSVYVINTLRNSLWQFKFTFYFEYGVYHTLFHSNNSKFNYDINKSTANDCLMDALHEKLSFKQLKDQFEKKIDNELIFSLKFNINVDNIVEIIKTNKENKINYSEYSTYKRMKTNDDFSDIDIKTGVQNGGDDDNMLNSHNPKALNMGLSLFWIYFHFLDIYEKLKFRYYPPNKTDTTETLLAKFAMYITEYNYLKSDGFEINYKAKNIMIGFNELLIYYETIRDIVESILNFDYSIIDNNIINILFEYISFDDLDTGNKQNHINQTYKDAFMYNEFNDNYIGYNICYECIGFGENMNPNYENKKIRLMHNRMSLNRFNNC